MQQGRHRLSVQVQASCPGKKPGAAHPASASCLRMASCRVHDLVQGLRVPHRLRTHSCSQPGFQLALGRLAAELPCQPVQQDECQLVIVHIIVSGLGIGCDAYDEADALELGPPTPAPRP